MSKYKISGPAPTIKMTTQSVMFPILNVIITDLFGNIYSVDNICDAE